MKKIRLLFLFLFFPFVACAMKIESPYQDQFRAPESRPGSPELLRHVSTQLQKYDIAKKTLEDMKQEFSKLGINIINLNKVIDIFARLSDKIIHNIMYDLYPLTQMQLKPKSFAKQVSIALTKYIK